LARARSEEKPKVLTDSSQRIMLCLSSPQPTRTCGGLM
jgi:hypothetical protein